MSEPNGASTEAPSEPNESSTQPPSSIPAQPPSHPPNQPSSSSLSHPQQPPSPDHTLTSPSSTILVSLSYSPLSLPLASRFISSPTSGANIIFSGTTRNNFDNRPVSRLSYSAYPKLALSTLLRIATEVQERHGLEKVYIVHRLGEVPVGEESIIVGVSSAHRGGGWRGAEELLEKVKEKVEIWKREWFSDVEEGKDGEGGGGGGTGGNGKGERMGEVGVWKANKDRDAMGKPVGK